MESEVPLQYWEEALREENFQTDEMKFQENSIIFRFLKVPNNLDGWLRGGDRVP